MEQYNVSDAIQEAYLRHEDERIIESLESRAMHYSARARALRLVEKVSLLPTTAGAFFAGTEVFSGDYVTSSNCRSSCSCQRNSGQCKQVFCRN